jgi:hypothetical protein
MTSRAAESRESIAYTPCWRWTMAAGSPPDRDALRQELRDYHDAFIDAHVGNRPEFFVQDLAYDYVNVSRGDLLRQTRQEILDTFTDYLDSTEFSEYRLIGEPTIGLSRDGSAAWSIFQLRVAGVRTMSEGTEVRFDSTWGCLILFERRGDRWVRIAEASNHKPN